MAKATPKKAALKKAEAPAPKKAAAKSNGKAAGKKDEGKANAGLIRIYRIRKLPGLFNGIFR